MDEFEYEYADELDAIDDDFDPDSVNLTTLSQKPPKSKKSLKFATPNRNNPSQLSQVNSDLDDSLFRSSPPLEYSQDFDVVSQEKVSRKRLPSGDDEDWLDETDGHNGRSLFDEDEPEKQYSSRKRQKISEENPAPRSEIEEMNERMIEKIQMIRERSKEVPQQENVFFIQSQHRVNDGEDLERPRVKKKIPQTDFVSTRGYEGDKVYMKLWDEDVLQAEVSSLGQEARAVSLLPVPVCIMREKLEDEISRKRLNEFTELQESIERQLTHDSGADTDAMVTDSTEVNGVLEEVRHKEDESVADLTNDMRSLWVEKYAPRRYTELLSEETINRNLLHWLKLWDFVVFGKDVPKPLKKQNTNKEKEKKWKKFQAQVEENLDKHHRPSQLVALLCGPPGLGKTTLAHIVAQHAGYNVVEMNASDDRAAEVFKNKLESATQMRSVNQDDARPNCLVIDEIDGAPLPAINALMNMIKKSDKEQTTSKKKKEGSLLLRPIICVCNDQYVPALRQLRQVALVCNFPQTEPSKLASRLFEVVRVEQLKADINALLALCERTDNDIRSCLNTLQFVRRKQKELTLRDVQSMTVGQKDTQKSLFSVWHDVFTLPKPKKKNFISYQDPTSSASLDNTSPTARFSHILQLCQSAGEYEKVLQGIHENYLEAKCKDPHLTGLNLASEWICFSDKINRYTGRSQDYSLVKFTSFLPILFHFLYASNAPARIQYPHTQHEATQSSNKTLNLLTSLMADMTPGVRKFVNPRNMTLDLLPPLLDVLTPTLRPVNAQLYSGREKAELSNVVAIMINYNMTYLQTRSVEGQYVYTLEPNVEEVVRLSGLKQRKTLTYAAKQMIAREIDLEKMRRSEKPSVQTYDQVPPVTTPVTPATDDLMTSAGADNSKDQAKAPVPHIPNHLRKLQAKTVEDKPAINFFGNFTRTKRVKVVKETDEPQEDPAKKQLLDTAIWFHFKEGFSNAVRRNVKIQDLL